MTSRSPSLLSAVAAIKIGDVAGLKAYLDAWGDPNANDGTSKATTLLHWACYLGSVACAAALLESPKTRVDITEVDGKTPLHWAAFEGHCDVIELLCQHGARVTMRDSLGHTPYSLATMQRHHEAANLLRLVAEHQEAQSSPPLMEEEERVPQNDGSEHFGAAATTAPPILLVPRALSPIQQLTALRRSTAGLGLRRDVWPTVEATPSAARSESLDHRGEQEPLSAVADNAEEELEFEAEADAFLRRSYLERVRRDQSVTSSRASSQRSQSVGHVTQQSTSRAASTEETERLLAVAQEHVEVHERRRHGTEFSELDEELRRERLAAARHERRELEREELRLEKQQQKLARREARRRKRQEWLGEVLRLAALSHEIPREEYIARMEHIAVTYHAAASGDMADSSIKPLEACLKGPNPPSQLLETQAPLERPRDASSWLPEPTPAPQRQHVVSQPSLANWRTQLGTSAPASERSLRPSRATTLTTTSSANSERTSSPPARITLRQPPVAHRADAAQPSARRTASATDSLGSRVWKPPSAARVEPVPVCACQVTTRSSSRSARPPTPKVTAVTPSSQRKAESGPPS